MTIIQQPEAYNFAGNVPNFIIDSSVNLPFRLLKGAEVLLDEIYTPSPDERIEIELYGFFEKFLSIDIPFNFTLDVYDQVDGVAEFTAEIGDGSSPDQVVFTVVKGGVDNLENDVSFMQENFLTWQEPVKRVRLEDTEWLTYFSDQAVDVMVRSTADDDTGETITLMSLAADKLSCINVTPSILAQSLTKNPVKLEVFIEVSSVIISSIQTYILYDDTFKFEDRFLFENSVGGVDTIIFTGEAITSEDNEFDKALIGRDTIEYLVSNNLFIKKNTGDFRSDRHLLWARDFFLSKTKYHYLGIEILKVIFSNSEISRVKNSLNSYEFTFKHTRESVYQRVPILSFDFKETFVVLQTTTNSILNIGRFSLSSGDITVDWGDDSQDVYSVGVTSISHDYSGTGSLKKDVTIIGDASKITAFACEANDGLINVDISELTGLLDLSLTFNDDLLNIDTGDKSINGLCKILIGHNTVLDMDILDMTQFKNISEICNFSLNPFLNKVLFAPDQSNSITVFKLSGDLSIPGNQGISGVQDISMFSNLSGLFGVDSNPLLETITYPSTSGAVFTAFNIANNAILSGNQNLSWASITGSFLAFDTPLITGYTWGENGATTVFAVNDSGLIGPLVLTSFSDIGGKLNFKNNRITSTDFPASSTPITEFNGSNNLLTGIYDVSNLNMGGSFRLNDNLGVTDVSFSATSNSFVFFEIKNSDLGSLDGSFDYSMLENAATYINFSGNSNLEVIVSPTTTYTIAQFIANDCNINPTIDLSGMTNIGQLQLNNNSNLSSIIRGGSFGDMTLFFARNCNLTGSLDLSGGNVDTWLDVNDNPLLTGLILIAGLKDFSTAFYLQNTAIDYDFNFGTDILFSRASYNGNGMSQINVDENINNIYANKGLFSSPKQIASKGTNPVPTGVYDASTDWASGLPTSPMAKVYDLENNVTGVYDFSFFDLI